ncbi:MAG: hypothetical protein QGF90_18380 [Gammaproteobacteria bacterium]|jgi:F0F1-type ATP synthase assembly protein I|nr:hypothetical protein [Gammaproteobacteria bacterium]|tara:strand:- start:102 stop:305 length:204 start_codon:yes stop_codon:yes gene_type:complete
MSSKSKTRKATKSAVQGTYALCITVGLIVGVGLGPILGSVPIASLIGAVLGAGAGYFFSHLKKRSRR